MYFLIAYSMQKWRVYAWSFYHVVNDVNAYLGRQREGGVPTHEHILHTHSSSRTMSDMFSALKVF